MARRGLLFALYMLPIYLVGGANAETQHLTVYSGKKDSGHQANYSDWYTLCTAPLPAGFRIIGQSFDLTGDRRCGGYAECEFVSGAPSKYCYRFRMQGHNEGGTLFAPNDGVTQSEGVITYDISNE